MSIPPRLLLLPDERARLDRLDERELLPRERLRDDDRESLLPALRPALRRDDERVDVPPLLRLPPDLLDEPRRLDDRLEDLEDELPRLLLDAIAALPGRRDYPVTSLNAPQAPGNAPACPAAPHP